MKKRWIISVMVGIGLLLGTQSKCLADPYLELILWDTVHGDIVKIQDGSLLDASPLVGVISYTGAVGTGVWTANITGAMTYPMGGSTQANPYLDLSSVNSSTGAGNLVVFADAIGYTGLISGGKTGPFNLEAGGTLGGLTSGSINFGAWYTSGNVLYYDGGSFTAIGSLLDFSPKGHFGETTLIPALTGTASPYGLGIRTDITHDGAGITSYNTDLQGVPEPATLLLLGFGLIGLAGIRRKFKK